MFLPGSEIVVGTLWAQLLLQFYTDPSDMHVLFTESKMFVFFPHCFHIFILDDFSCFNIMNLHMYS